MRECCVVCTYRRTEMLHCCLRRLRGQDGDIKIFVFSDRGEFSKQLEWICTEFEAKLIVQPDHDWFGNSYSAGEALRFVYNSGFDLIHVVEDDTFVKSGFFDWTRQVHEDFDNIFCSCAWVFNRYAPIEEGTYFAPWIYIPQFSIKRQMLELVLPHLGPIYYRSMRKYVIRNFKGNPIHLIHPHATYHCEIDGMLQHILLQHKLQVTWNGIAKVAHLGYAGYNRGGYQAYEEFFKGEKDFRKRVDMIEELAADPYWRTEIFGKEIVDRELGYELPERRFRYRMTVGPYESEFDSSLLPHQLPRVINSVPRTAETVVESL